MWPGEIHAVVGENGAGKSTLMKVLSGVHHQTAGQIIWEGRETGIGSPSEAQKLGIRMVYQELSLVPDLSVAENICLGRMPRRGPFLDRATMLAEARRALEGIGSGALDPDEMVGNLSISQRQLVEIARVTSSGARLVVLDEPTSSLSEHEAQKLLSVVRGLRQGIAIIYISHRLHEVLAIAERVTVMRDGRSIETRGAEGVTAGELVQMMVGRTLEDVFPKAAAPIGDVVFEAKHLSGPGFRDISIRCGAERSSVSPG